MNQRIAELVKQIRELEDELRDALTEQQERFQYHIKGKRVEFEKLVADTHRQLKVGLLSWLADSQLRNIISAPFIYSMIFPAMLLDLFLWMFQATCFRLYGIPRVKRGDYIVIDRHKLAYLNSIERFNCVYCAYVNGLFSYAVEVGGRTEQYWCPIKHARKVAATHQRYAEFLDYGEAENYPVKVQDLRKKLRACETCESDDRAPEAPQ